MWEEGVLLVVVVHERKVTQALNHDLLLALEVGLEVHISLLLFYSPKANHNPTVNFRRRHICSYHTAGRRKARNIW